MRYTDSSQYLLLTYSISILCESEFSSHVNDSKESTEETDTYKELWIPVLKPGT